MKIISWNCRGLGIPSAIRSLLELQRAEDPDALFLSNKIDGERAGLAEMEAWIAQHGGEGCGWS